MDEDYGALGLGIYRWWTRDVVDEHLGWRRWLAREQDSLAYPSTVIVWFRIHFEDSKGYTNMALRGGYRSQSVALINL